MFRYLAGLLFVQLITLGLFALNADADPRALALRVGAPAFAIALLAALWFRTLSRADAERDLARTHLEHERERERIVREAERERAGLTLAAERERADVARAAERTIRREERRAGRRASLQVGLAFAATGGMGVLFVLTELVTLGLLTLTAGSSALGGYVLRWRQTRSRQPRSRLREPPPDTRVLALPDPTSTAADTDADTAADTDAVAPVRRRTRGAPGRTGV